MVTIGQVTAGGDAVVRLVVQDFPGTEREIMAALDTGFNGFLTLPSSLIEALELQQLGREQVVLASGETRLTSKYGATVLFAGKRYPVEIVEAGESLVGMALLWGYELRMQCIEGGRVEIKALPVGE